MSLSFQPAKPPKFELDGKKWAVEFHVKPSSPFVISETETNQSVYMYKCEGTTVQVLLQLNHRMNILSVLFDLEEPHLIWVSNVNELANPGSAKGVVQSGLVKWPNMLDIGPFSWPN